MIIAFHNHKGGIGKTTMERVTDLATQRGTSVFEAMGHLDEAPDLGAARRQRAVLRQARHMAGRARAAGTQFFQDVLGRLHQLGALLDQRMAALGLRRVDGTGDREYLAAGLDGQPPQLRTVGIDDELLGQVIKAFIVGREGSVPTPEQVKAHCRARLPIYKIPKHVEFVAALPRTASGKVRRVQLAGTPQIQVPK